MICNIHFHRSIDGHSLIGNIGGYIGLCLGYNLLQVPALLSIALRILKENFKSKEIIKNTNYNIKSLDTNEKASNGHYENQNKPSDNDQIFEIAWRQQFRKRVSIIGQCSFHYIWQFVENINKIFQSLWDTPCINNIFQPLCVRKNSNLKELTTKECSLMAHNNNGNISNNQYSYF